MWKEAAAGNIPLLEQEMYTLLRELAVNHSVMNAVKKVARETQQTQQAEQKPDE